MSQSTQNRYHHLHTQLRHVFLSSGCLARTVMALIQNCGVLVHVLERVGDGQEIQSVAWLHKKKTATMVIKEGEPRTGCVGIMSKKKKRPLNEHLNFPYSIQVVSLLTLQSQIQPGCFLIVARGYSTGQNVSLFSHLVFVPWSG